MSNSLPVNFIAFKGSFSLTLKKMKLYKDTLMPYMTRKRSRQQMESTGSSSTTVITKKPRVVEESDPPQFEKFEEIDPDLGLLISLLKSNYEQTVARLLDDKRSRTLPEGTELSDESTDSMHKKYSKDPTNKLLRGTLSNLPLQYLAMNREFLQKLNFTYSDVLTIQPYPSNQ